MRWCVLLSLILSLVAGCGDPQISLPEDRFQPKLVVQGFMIPGQDVDVLVTRNFPLATGSEINIFDLVSTDAIVTLTSAGTAYTLHYNPNTLTYQPSSSIEIEYGQSCWLDVQADFEGTGLSTSVSTTVPMRGFQINRAASRLEPMQYREKDESDDPKLFKIAYDRSPGVDFYVISITALDASDETFVYDNPFFDYDTSDVNFNMSKLRSTFEWAQNQSADVLQVPGTGSQEIQWVGLPFYGRYRAIAYACDQNLKDFFLTHSIVQTIDGNFFEPAFHLEGDGIGVFASAIADTVFFEILR